jgi:hypothetical protein
LPPELAEGADAFDLGRVQRVDLVPALTLVLQPDLDRQVEQRAEPGFQLGLAGDLAPDVTDNPAKPCAQEAQLPPHPFELMRVAVAPDHDRRTLGHAHIALA